MLLGLLLAAQAVSQPLLNEADARNAAFVTCLFSVSRDARSWRLDADQFEQELAGACQPEEEVLRTVSVRILQLRGHSAAEAADRTTKLLQEARQSVEIAYRQPY